MESQSSIPFHSKSLPGKRKLLELIPSFPPKCYYQQRLRNELQDLSVIGLAAVNTAESISKQAVLKSPWLRWQAGIMETHSSAGATRTTRNWHNEGKITAHRHPVNRYRLFKRKELDALLRRLRDPRSAPQAEINRSCDRQTERFVVVPPCLML